METTSPLVTPATGRLSLKSAALALPLVTIWLTSTLYFAGVLYDATTLNHFGLEDTILDRSTQQVIAQGFSGFVVGFPEEVKLFATVGILALIVTGLAVGGLLAIPLSRGDEGTIRKRATLFYRLLAWAGVGPGVMVAIFLPAAGAALAAKARVGRIDAVVRSGCTGCNIYRTKTADLLGFFVAGDKTRVVIAVASGAQVTKLDDLLAVMRRQPTRAAKSGFARDNR